MASLFQGTPQTAFSTTKSTTETPEWMQKAIYDQVGWATNVANTPYQPYSLPTVAELSKNQQDAYKQVANMQGAWKGDMNYASSGMKDFSTKGTAGDLQTAQGQYLRQGLVDQNLNAGQGYFNQAGKMDAIGAASPLLNRAASMDIVGASQPYLSQAGQQNIMGAASPYMQQSSQTTAEALSDRALNAANPYLTAAAQSAASGIGQYTSPYQQSVLDVIAKQGCS